MVYYNARAQLLFCSLNLLFGDVLVAVAVVFCVRSLILLGEERHCESKAPAKRSQHANATYRNIGGQTHATCCAQQCCDMLRWHVAIVWPGLKVSCSRTLHNVLGYESNLRTDLSGEDRANRATTQPPKHIC